MAEFQDYITSTSLPEVNARLIVLDQQLQDMQTTITAIIVEMATLNAVKTQMEAYITP